MTHARTAVCTICAKNYTARARTLMASLARHEPDWERHVLFVDEIEGYVDPDREDFRVWTDREIGLPHRPSFLFRYELVEANTAVKPWFLGRLFEAGYTRVVYLDPDVQLLTALPEVAAAHAEGAALVLTPHITRPQPESGYPGEAVFLQYGIYNLGFLALEHGGTTTAFLAWWQGHLEHDSVIDPPRGRFVDQKWVDLVPGLFPQVRILRHEGYNVAHWNLASRAPRLAGTSLMVNEVPLRFLHFSAFDPTQPELLTRTGTQRAPVPAPRALAPLCRAYAEQLAAHGETEVRHWPYAYAATADGVTLPRCLRRLARGADADVLGDDPFRHAAAYFNEDIAPLPATRLPFTRTMDALWRDIPELTWLHADARGSGRLAYARWFVRHGPEHGIDDAFLAPVREAVQRRRRRARRLFPRD